MFKNNTTIIKKTTLFVKKKNVEKTQIVHGFIYTFVAKEKNKKLIQVSTYGIFHSTTSLQFNLHH